MFLQVRKAAYQSLGPFISTFYDPDAYSSPEDYLGDKESLELQLENNNDYQFEEQNRNGDNSNTTEKVSSGGHCNRDNNKSPTDVKVECSNCACHMESVKVNVMAASETLVSVEYSSFNFWKTPLPQVDDLELDSLTLEDKSIKINVEKSSKTMHVHLTVSNDKINEGGDDAELSSTKNSEKQVVETSEKQIEKTSEKQVEDTHTSVDNSQQQHTNSSNALNDDTVEVDTSVHGSENNTETITNHGVKVNDNSGSELLVAGDEDQSSNERTNPILVSDVVTNELGEEIIEISEIDVKDDDAISQQLTSLSNNTSTPGNGGNSGLHIINNKTQAGWGSLSSSADDTQTDGGVISCLIPRVKITSHTDLSFGMPGVVNFDSHDDSMNYDPHDYYHKTTGSQVDMDITLDGVEETLASKQVCNLLCFINVTFGLTNHEIHLITFWLFSCFAAMPTNRHQC